MCKRQSPHILRKPQRSERFKDTAIISSASYVNINRYSENSLGILFEIHISLKEVLYWEFKH